MKKITTIFGLGIPVIAALLLLAVPAYAGGWATVGITEMPEEIQAGSPFTIEFMVWQHGNKAVHKLYWDNNERIPVTPLISFTSPETGEKLTFDAQPVGNTGLFRAEITLPAGGEWQWSISPEPMASVTKLDPLVVKTDVTATLTTKGSAGTLALPAGTAQRVALAAGALLLGLTILTLRSQLKKSVTSNE